jgi:hypothetical protein
MQQVRRDEQLLTRCSQPVLFFVAAALINARSRDAPAAQTAQSVAFLLSLAVVLAHRPRLARSRLLFDWCRG